MSLDDGLYLTSIYESLTVKYFFQRFVAGQVLLQQDSSYTLMRALKTPTEDDIRVAGQGKFHPIYILTIKVRGI